MWDNPDTHPIFLWMQSTAHMLPQPDLHRTWVDCKLPWQTSHIWRKPNPWILWRGLWIFWGPKQQKTGHVGAQIDILLEGLGIMYIYIYIYLQKEWCLNLSWGRAKQFTRKRGKPWLDMPPFICSKVDIQHKDSGWIMILHPHLMNWIPKSQLDSLILGRKNPLLNSLSFFSDV